jgi:hypothetical protein
MFTERETYLAAASTMLQHGVFTAAGIEPAQWEAKKYRVSCGFPLGFRGSRSGKYAIGQAFDPSISADGTCEIFINPILAEPAQVIAVLIHELIHVFAGVQAGHKGEFARIARAVGLEGKLTATVAGAELQAKIDAIVAQLGAYPHAAIDPQSRKKQGTRLLKMQCGECQWTARVSMSQWNRVRTDAPCPCCSAPMLSCDGNYKSEDEDGE